MRGERARARSGLTLIEILAVVTILALMMALVIPNTSGMRRRALHGEAERIGARLELARQRAIVTGVPHRLWMDLDQAEYRLEWLADDPDAPPVSAAEPGAFAGNSPISLEAPREQALAYQPVPGNFGRLEVVEYPFYFEALETPEGRIERGQAEVVFQRDGTADHSEIYIEDSAGHRVALEVLPLDERVRVRRDP